MHKYGVTSNAIAPGAATRLTATVPEEKRRTGAGSIEDDPTRSPANVAPVCAYLASDRSDWITGRTLSSSGYRVGMYNVPEEISSIESQGPWQLDDLAAKMEKVFEPIADTGQLARYAHQV